MHARNRSPANGYRSNPIGIGGGGPAYRSYNRGGFGRGQPKVFQPPPPRRGDILMEAGKLATEYLVSKGLLPPNSLNVKWQNSNFRHQIGSENGAPDEVSGTGSFRKRFLSRDGVRDETKHGSFKNIGFESNREATREINRSSSWSEKTKGSPVESFSGSLEEPKSSKHGGGEEQRSASCEEESKSCDNTTIKKSQSPNELADDNGGSKDSSSVVECGERSDSSKNVNNEESEKQSVVEDERVENGIEESNDNQNKNGSDLLTLIRFNKVPTRTRSSVTLKGSKVDPVLIGEDEKINQTKNVSKDVSMGDAENQGLNPESNVLEASSPDKVVQFEDKFEFRQESQSFLPVSEQESGEGPAEYNRSSSVVLERGEKRPLDVVDSGEGAKKARDWAGSSDQGDVFVDQAEGCNAYAEEKQLFPGSFKICDLNLMEVSDVNENVSRDTSSVLAFPSMVQPKQELEPVSVNFDLSMSSIGERHTRRGADGKEVEVIDLDCDPVQDDKVFNNSEQKEDTIFTDLDGFPDSMPRVNEMPQDGYGLMISELLEADIPSSTVTTGVNSMHNDIGLHNEEGMLGDDESIYMSLGEIPISFVQVWDQQPSQGYDKRY